MPTCLCPMSAVVTKGVLREICSSRGAWPGMPKSSSIASSFVCAHTTPQPKAFGRRLLHISLWLKAICSPWLLHTGQSLIHSVQDTGRVMNFSNIRGKA